MNCVKKRVINITISLLWFYEMLTTLDIFFLHTNSHLGQLIYSTSTSTGWDGIPLAMTTNSLGNELELGILWHNYPPNKPINDFSYYKIKAERIYWENIPHLADRFWSDGKA